MFPPLQLYLLTFSSNSALICLLLFIPPNYILCFKNHKDINKKNINRIYFKKVSYTEVLFTFAGNETISSECTVPQLENSEVDITYVPDERAGFFTHVVWNVTWNLTSCTCLCTHDLGCLRWHSLLSGQEKVTGFTVTVDPRECNCGETLQQTVDSVGGVHI